MKDAKFIIIALVFCITVTVPLIVLKLTETDYEEELTTMVGKYEFVPTPTPTCTPTPTPSPTPTVTPTPTPIVLMSNQEYYNECVARGLVTPANDYDDRITKERGGYMGPSGRETYYNLYMGNCVNYMR